MGSWRLCLLWSLLWAAGLFSSYALAATEAEGSRNNHLTYFAGTEDGNERRLISDLHRVLERLQDHKNPALRKKHSYMPKCDPGELCALRRGSRIGKLCDCPQPRTCNSFLHRCL